MRDARQHFFIAVQFHAQQSGNEVTRQIITRWSKATGDDDEIRAPERFMHRGLHRNALVRDGELPRHRVAEVRELTTKPLLVCVQHAPEHQFAANVDDFNLHALETANAATELKCETGVKNNSRATDGKLEQEFLVSVQFAR